MTNSAKKRMIELDYAKGIGIIAMIIGHISLNTELPHEISHYIHVWNMPLFFIVSGYLFMEVTETEFRTFLKGRARSLLVPYLVWGIFSWIFYVAIKYVFQKEELELAVNSLQYVFGYNNVFFPISGALWFLTAMFFVQVMYFFLKKKVRSGIYRGLIIGFIAIVAYLFSINENYHIPLSLDSALSALPFFALGDWAKGKKSLERLTDVKAHTLTLFLVLIGFMSILGAFLNDSVNIRTLTYGNPILFYLNAFISSLFILILARWIFLFVNINWLQYIGENSIVYLIFNQMILAVLYRVFDKISFVPEWIELFVSLAIVIMVCSCLVYVLQKMLPWTIGKKKCRISCKK